MRAACGTTLQPERTVGPQLQERPADRSGCGHADRLRPQSRTGWRDFLSQLRAWIARRPFQALAECEDIAVVVAILVGRTRIVGFASGKGAVSRSCSAIIESRRGCGCPSGSGLRRCRASQVRLVGEWLSLVEHLVRDQGVGGSNPLSPTNIFNNLAAVSGFSITSM